MYKTNANLRDPYVLRFRQAIKATVAPPCWPHPAIKGGYFRAPRIPELRFGERLQATHVPSVDAMRTLRWR
ncbi:hypothetical protein MRX96_030361 [Rhipicephalus microplus]